MLVARIVQALGRGVLGQLSFLFPAGRSPLRDRLHPATERESPGTGCLENFARFSHGDRKQIWQVSAKSRHKIARGALIAQFYAQPAPLIRWSVASAARSAASASAGACGAGRGGRGGPCPAGRTAGARVRAGSAGRAGSSWPGNTTVGSASSASSSGSLDADELALRRRRTDSSCRAASCSRPRSSSPASSSASAAASAASLSAGVNETVAATGGARAARSRGPSRSPSSSSAANGRRKSGRAIRASASASALIGNGRGLEGSFPRARAAARRPRARHSGRRRRPSPAAASSAGAGSKSPRSDGAAAAQRQLADPFAAALDRRAEPLDQLDQAEAFERRGFPVGALGLRRRGDRHRFEQRPRRLRTGLRFRASGTGVWRASEGAENGSGSAARAGPVCAVSVPAPVPARAHECCSIGQTGWNSWRSVIASSCRRPSSASAGTVTSSA